MCEIAFHNIALAKEVVMHLVTPLVFVIMEYAYML
jgi:hypothetical protein